MTKIGATINLPRVYLNVGNFFLDFGWFFTGGEETLYGPTLTFQKIEMKSHSLLGRGFRTFCGGLRILCGEKELAITGGWSNADESK